MHTYVIAAVVVVSCGLLQGHPVGEFGWGYESKKAPIQSSDSVRVGCMEIDICDIQPKKTTKNEPEAKRQRHETDLDRKAVQAALESKSIKK